MEWQSSGTVNASFGEPRWLRFMLGPLDRRLTDIFTDQTVPGTPLRDRPRFVMALYTLADFMHNAGFAAGTVENWNELGAALDELSRGTVRHFLTPGRSQNRPIDAGDIWLARAHVAAALDLAVRNGRGVTEASNYIADAYAFLSAILSPTSQDFAGTIRKWRTDFLKEKIQDKRSARAFSNRHLMERYASMMLATRGDAVTPGAVAAQMVTDGALLATRAADKTAIEKALAKPAERRKRLKRKTNF